MALPLYPNKTVVIKLDDGKQITAEKALNYASGFLRDYLATTDASVEETKELPFSKTSSYEPNIADFELLNKFIKYADENLHDELRDHCDEPNFWIEELDKNKKQLLKIAEDATEETLLRSAK